MDKNRVVNMEEYFDLTIEDIKILKKCINKISKDKKKIFEVSKYYGSEEWFSDRDNYDNSVKAGILSEDIPYDSFVDLDSLAIKMVKLGIDILKASR